MTNRRFYSDNIAPAAPEFIAAIAAANVGDAASYGEDEWTAELQAAARDAFEGDGRITAFPVLNGKAANHLSLLAITEPGGVVFCHELSHILVDEDDGPERYTDAQFVGIVDDGTGRITTRELRKAIMNAGPVEEMSALSLTNATEHGTVYSVDEVRELVAIAHAAGLLVHLDGARIANAAVRLGASLADLTWRSGVDILSMGVTKNGGLSAEAVIVFNDEIAERFIVQRAWTGHVPSKMRFLSSQLMAGLRGDAWRRRAENANAMAARLATALLTISNVEIVRGVDANLLFVSLPAPLRGRFDRAGYVCETRPDLGEDVIRLVTNWSTTDCDIDELISALTTPALNR